MLPVGGKPLPDDALAQKPVPGLIASVAKPALSAAIAGDEIKPLAADAGKLLKAEPLPKPETQVVSRQLDAVRPGQRIPVVVDPGTIAKKGINVDFIKLKDGIPKPESDSVVARNNPLQTRSASSIRTTGEIGMTRISDIRAAVVTPQAQDSMASQIQPAVAAVVATTGPGSEEAAATTNKRVNQLTEVVFREMSPQREAVPEKVMRDITLPTETLPLRDVTSNVEHRSVEVPVQTSTNSTQQTMPNLASTAQVAVAAPNNLAPNPQPMPLPPQLETLSLAQNSSSTEWASGLSERVNWMINQKQNTAIIRLDPPALGKLDVQLKIVDDATMITIQTQHAQTRDLIESASVRLRDFLQENGYQNVNIDVSHRQDQQQARSQMQANVNADLQDESGLEQAAEHEQGEQISYFNGDGLVDTFA